MIFTALYTGLRFGELVGLMWSDIDFERMVITVQRSFSRGVLGSTKSNKIRKLPLAHNLALLLASKARISKYIFADESGQPIKRHAAQKAMKRLVIRACIKKAGWHTMRHTAASYMANNGVAIQIIQALLGHSDTRTTMRYSHIAPVTMINAVNVLEKCFDSDYWTQGGHNEQKAILEINELNVQPVEKILLDKTKTASCNAALV
jgi:integrase